METKLSELIERCRSETEHYTRQGVAADTQACWEIWRRAVVAQNNEAWQAVLEQYNYLVRSWLRVRIRETAQLQQEEDWLLNATFLKFFRAVDSTKFKNFPNLAALLRYLQTCCSSVVADEQRLRQTRPAQISLDNTLAGGSHDFTVGSKPNPIAYLPAKDDQEQELVNKISRQEFWQRIRQLNPDKVDLLLIHLFYELELPPRDVSRLYPQYFPDVEAVYKRRKNIVARLRNHPELLLKV